MKILIIAKSEETILKITQNIKDNRDKIILSENYNDALKEINAEKFDLIILDFNIGNKDFKDLFKIIQKKQNKNIRIILLTSYADLNTAINYMKLGAYDYLLKPIKIELLLNSIKYIRENINSNIISVDIELPKIIGNSVELLNILDKVNRIASTKVSVLITGESGTGKDLIAKSIHELSDRRNNNYVVLNCAALPDTLFESELFGFEKGAFTGAINSHEGKFEAANNGTLFIDEVGDMSLAAQSKLLRAIENNEVLRLGSNKIIKVDVRYIFATNKDLKQEVINGNFREDLYYRINVINLHMPSLKRRKEDIAIIFMYYIKKFSEEYNRVINKIDKNIFKILINYDWPGNVRQLKNTAEAMVSLCIDGNISFDLLPEDIKKSLEVSVKQLPDPNSKNKNQLMNLAEIEKNAILDTLKITNFNKSKTADILGVSLRTIQRKIKEYNILCS